MNLPLGTVLVKHFELPLDESKPDDLHRLETRVIVLQNRNTFYGATYRWNEEGTEAFLLETRETAEFEVRTPSGTRRHTWMFPGPGDCKMCHNKVAGTVLGVNVRQLNLEARDPATGELFNQLEAWRHAGLIAGKEIPEEADEEVKKKPVVNINWPRLPALEDESASLEDRSRAYFDVNCAHCHQPKGSGKGLFDFRYHVPLAYQGLSEANVRGVEEGVKRLLVPGKPEKSVLYYRLLTADYHRMPPIGRSVADEQAAEVVGRWIRSLPAESKKQ